MTDLIESAIRQIVKDEVERLNAERQPQPVKIENKGEKLFTAKEACRVLRCSLPTLHRWKKAGLISFVRIGTNIRYRQSDIDKVLTNKR